MVMVRGWRSLPERCGIASEALQRNKPLSLTSVDVSDTFLFFCSGEGVGGVRGEKGREVSSLQRNSGCVRARFCVRFQAVKVPISVDSQLRAQLRKQPPQSSSKGNFFVRVRFRVWLRSLSEYGSVAYFVERPTRETRAEQYWDTILETSWRN